MSNWAVKYRPKKFSELKGQPEKALLWNMLKTGAGTPPVLMLSGPPGTGKTTLARIVAASLNCEHPDAGEPCGQCVPCEEIFQDRYPAVHEYDAASYGGAEDMRKLRELTFVTTPGKVQVFIIDEAQSLSHQAWNVLLKTFEEPAAGNLFILVTSEPNKVPAKIRTRALRFDLSRLAPNVLKERVEQVLQLEGALVEDVDIIVDAAEGSMREALKLAEQVYVTGLESLVIKDLSVELLQALIDNDKVQAAKISDEWWSKVGDFRGIIDMLGLTMEKVLFVRMEIPTYVSPSKEKVLKVLASALSDHQWASAMEILADNASKVGTKASLIFLVARLGKALHGSALQENPYKTAPPEGREEPLGSAEIESMLKDGFVG